MCFKNSEFVDAEIDYHDEDFPEPGVDFESLCLHEALDRVDRARDMQAELRSYKSLFGN